MGQRDGLGDRTADALAVSGAHDDVLCNEPAEPPMAHVWKCCAVAFKQYVHRSIPHRANRGSANSSSRRVTGRSDRTVAVTVTTASIVAAAAAAAAATIAIAIAAAAAAAAATGRIIPRVRFLADFLADSRE